MLTYASGEQAAAGRAGGVRMSIPAIASQIYKTEGLRGFFVGATVRVGLKVLTLLALLVQKYKD